MLPEEIIYNYLSLQSEINTIVQDRIYPMLMPQDSKLPAITYQRISTVRKSILQAHSNFASIIMQFNCWSEKYSQSKVLADCLLRCMEAVNESSTDIGIVAALPEGELDRYEPDTKSYCVDIDVEFHYIENRLG